MDLEFNKHEDHNKLAVSELHKRLNKVHLGGGKKHTAKHKAKGKIPLPCGKRIFYSLC